MLAINNITYARDLEGNEYPIQATITHEGETNGNQSMSFTLIPSKVNLAVINDIAEMWEVIDFDGVEHKIIFAKRKGKGNLLNVDIKAIPLFFDTLDNDRIYDRYDEHMTANRAFMLIFEKTGFGFVLSDSFDAVNWEGFGEGESKLETFKRAIERYKAEFRIVGNTVYLERQIGVDKQFQYRYKLNADNIVQEIDANEMWTYAKGYGDYGDGEGGEDWENAKLEREYTSPLAKIIGIRHAPPIKNGNITTKSKMDRELKTLVDESLKISISADVYDLQKQNYPIAQNNLGDRVFVIDERIGLKEEVRVINQSITRNWKGEVIDVNLTFGTEGVSKRHQANIQTATKQINDLLSGRGKLPFSVLDDAVKNATKALQDAQTELDFTDNGIIATDKKDPNNVVILNSAGVGVSNDGGATFRTAMTGNGLVADVVTSGTLNTDRVVIYGGDGKSYAHLEGAEIETRGSHTRTWFGETTTEDVGIQLRYGRLRFHNYKNSRNLYFSDRGITTYIGGSDSEDGGYQGSGTIEFFSHRFDPNVRGLTLYSNRGTIGLQTDTRDIILDADSNSDIRARRGSVMIKPHIDTRPGYNHFRVAIKDNSSAADTDGYIAFGSSENGYASGIRFKKSRSGEPIIWATNGAGDRATGSFYGRKLYGDLMPRGSYAYVIAPRLRVVTDDNKGKYGDVQADRYLTSSGASAFVGARSAMFSAPKSNEATKLITELDLIRFTDNNNNPEFKISSNQSVSVDDGETTDNDKTLNLVVKTLQELIERVEVSEGA